MQFGLVGRGEAFVRALGQVLRPIKLFSKSYVDDVAVHTNSCNNHLNHVHVYLQTVKTGGFALKFLQWKFARDTARSTATLSDYVNALSILVMFTQRL